MRLVGNFFLVLFFLFVAVVLYGTLNTEGLESVDKFDWFTRVARGARPFRVDGADSSRGLLFFCPSKSPLFIRDRISSFNVCIPATLYSVPCVSIIYVKYYVLTLQKSLFIVMNHVHEQYLNYNVNCFSNCS